MTAKLSQLRDALALILIELASGDGATSSEVVALFKQRHKQLVQFHSEDLKDIALIKLVNDVGKRRPLRSATPQQGDLFADYAGPSVITLSPQGSKERKKKTVLDMTINEALIWLNGHKKTRERDAREAEEIDHILEQVRPFASGEMTIREAINAANEANRAKGQG